MFMKIFRRLNIQRFSTLDVSLYLGNAGFQGMRYGAGTTSISEILVFTLILILIWSAISVSLQLFLGLKLFNGYSLSEDIDSPRY